MTDSPMALGLAGLSFLLTAIWGEPLLRILRHYKIGDLIRIEGPQRHFTKMGTPTMGGVLFILPVLFLTVLLNAVSLIGFTVLGRSVLVPLGAMIGFAFLGGVDDYVKLSARRRRGEGLRARTIFLIQLAFAVLIAIGLRYVLDVPEMFLPGRTVEISLGIFYVPIAALVIVYMANGSNFTDGLDGLAGLIMATAFAAFGAIALIQEQIFLARFCFTLVGAVFGFLWFNVHPAQLFMGDTGSQPLGATLAVVALMTGQWLLLAVIAIVPVSEVLSVMIQVGYFKMTGGKRFFKMAPLHNHFVLLGWSETQIVQRFWLISLLAAMAGVALAMV
jgi:phospho-N-acetylmuramoyl-pentapeptide-transferase